MCDILNN